MNKEKYKVIVIGVSAGGLFALTIILGNLPSDYPFPIIIVQHRSKDHKDLLEEVIQTKCNIKIVQANEKEKIEGGFVYIAPPDYHLLVENDKTFSLSSDERVCYSRPSINVLFESAARVYKDELIGIILTGANNDGASGIKEISESGGLTIAQDPAEAQFPFMPNAAIETNNIKYIWTLSEINSFLFELPIPQGSASGLDPNPFGSGICTQNQGPSGSYFGTSKTGTQYSGSYTNRDPVTGDLLTLTEKSTEKPMEKKDKAVILIVDDKPANILALEALLVSKDRTILNATCGKDALKITLNKDVDLIILDVQMPDMDGFEVAQVLNLNKRTRDIPIIFASAEKKEHKFMMQGFEEGAVDYLYKPLDPEIVRAKVSVLLKIQLQKKELLEKNLLLEKSSLLINNSADIIGIIDSKTFKIEEINKAFTEILGYSHEETKETALTFFLSNEDRINVQKLSKHDKEQLSFETSIYCKDRSIKWLQWNVVAKYGKWFANARDITEIKQVEKIRNYLATVVKQSKDAIYIHDNEGKIISWNEGAEEIYGYTEKEAVKMKIWNIIPEYMQPQTQEIMNKIISEEKIQDIETKRITKHGKLIDVLFSASVISDSENTHKSIAINERDITQQKISDDKIKHLNLDLQNNITQLESTNKELESFSYSVSHDLRAPLRALTAFSRILEEDYGQVLDDEAKRLLKNIQDNSQKMSTLINELLAFSKLGRKQLEKKEINVLDMVENILAELNPTKPVNTVIKVNDLSNIHGDYTLLNQVWVNLISNAIKYSAKKENPLVEIGETQSENETIYYIKDNGAGFNMKYADKLFGVFQRLHSENEFDGTGVGLAIVNKVIIKHGGKIWAEAKVNEGATFFFSLPKSVS